MKLLVVLFGVFGIGLVVTKLTTGNFDYIVAGNVAMGAMLWLTALGHFIYADGMTKMLPDFVPFKKPIVWITGVMEFAAGIALNIQSVRRVDAILLIIFLILIFPSNIYTAYKRIDYTKGTATGQGPSYLWFRVPMQLLFIAWIYYFSILH